MDPAANWMAHLNCLDAHIQTYLCQTEDNMEMSVPPLGI